MQSRHALSTASAASSDAVFAAVEAVIARRPDGSDRLEADLALDSLELARITAAVPFDLTGHLATLDFDRLVQLTVADLVPTSDQPATDQLTTIKEVRS